MLDVGVHIRSAYFSVLNGNIIIEGNAVPVVDEKLDVDVSEQDVYVMFTSQDEEAQGVSNKSYLANEVLLRLQIVNQRRSTNTKEVVEDVANQILTILFPTRSTWSVALDSPLSLTYVRLINAHYNPLVQNDKGFQISKILTFKNRITQ